MVGGTCGKISGFSTGGVLRAFRWVCGCVSVARSTEGATGSGGAGQPWPQRPTGGTRALALDDASGRGMAVKNGCKVAVAGGLTSKRCGWRAQAHVFRAFVSAEVTMAQPPNPLLPYVTLCTYQEERSANNRTPGTTKTLQDTPDGGPQSFVAGLFPLWNSDLWSITDNTVAPPARTPRLILGTRSGVFARQGCCCAPQAMSKRRARLCAGTGSHAVEPRQPNGKWRIVDFSFVSFFPVSTLGS